jgi:integrase
MTDEKMTVAEAVAAYIGHLMLSRKPRTAEQATFVLHPFKRIFGARPLHSFTRHDHDNYILNLPQGARTKTNHSVRICALLRHFDFPEGELKRMAKARPKFIKKPPVSYTQAEIDKFMAAARDHSFEAYAYFLFLWKSGVRDQEAAHATIDDVRDGVLHITAKNGFSPKNSEEREIPLPDDVRRLIAQLDRKPGQLLFPSRNGTVSQTWALIYLTDR